jgi:hypothetical protein
MAKVLDGVDLNDPALLKDPQYQVAVGTIALLATEANLEQIVRDWQRREGALLKISGREVSFFGGSFRAQVAKDGQLSLQFMDETGSLHDSGGSMSLLMPTLAERLLEAAANRVIVLKYEAAGRLAGLDTPLSPDRIILPSAFRKAREVAEKVAPGRLGKLIERTVGAVAQLVDAETVAIVRCYNPGRVSLKTYNFIAKNRAVFEKLHKEAPQLLPLLRKAVGERIIRKIDLNAFQKLKKRVRENGYTEAAWKNLIRMPSELLARLAAEYDMDDCLRAGDLVAEVGAVPPAELLDVWLRYESRMPTPLWFRRAAAQQANTLRSEREMHNFLNQYQTAMNWVHALQVRPDANQMRAGWKWIKRQVDAWLEEVRLVNSGRDCSWTSLVAEYVAGKGKYCIVPLTSSRQLRDEGNRMSNCVGRYGYDRKCVAGTSRIFSVRAAASGKSLATVELCKTGNIWMLSAIKASHNRVAKDCHVALMPELVEKYNAAYSRVFAEAPPEKSDA